MGGAGEWRWGAGRRRGRPTDLGPGRTCVDVGNTVTHPSSSLWAAERLSGASETALCGAPHWSDRIPQPWALCPRLRKRDRLSFYFLFLIELGNLQIVP